MKEVVIRVAIMQHHKQMRIKYSHHINICNVYTPTKHYHQTHATFAEWILLK